MGGKEPVPTSHGVLMWFAWTVIALCQIITNRYMKHYWRWRQFIHTVLGTISGVLTLSATLLILNWLDWHFYKDYAHNVLGAMFMVILQILVFLGVYNLVLRRLVNMDWKTAQMRSYQSIHKYMGYAIIFIVQIVIITGIVRRTDQSEGNGNVRKRASLITTNVLLFIGVLLVGEYIH
jgi:hypothetical protein